ncbi:MAG: serine protease [Acidimicrobiia bacterium]|nr:serine protease [Acidimicrobiia bacterium]
MRLPVGRWLVSLVLVAAACTSQPAETTIGPTTSTVAPTTTTTLLDVEALANRHLVEIRSEGTFLDRSGPDAPGMGTGLIVSADGLVLTTATAVVGADRINVFVADEEFPIEARIEALAECQNLALIKIDGTFNAASINAAGAPVGLMSMVERSPALDNGNPAIDLSSISVGPWTVGGVAVDGSGAIAGMAIAADEDGDPVILPLNEMDRTLRAMRSRETVQQLGFAAVDHRDGVAVTGVALGSDADGAGLVAGDVITAVSGDSLEGGLQELCARDDSGPVELVRDGRRYVGDFSGTALALASARTLTQLREAVIRVDAFTPGFDEPGSGSGFFISEDGLAVTNYHVVAGADRVELVFDGGDRRVPATILGRSMCHDLAVVQADGDGYEFVEWSPDPIRLEQPVRSIGFPLGTDTITVQPGNIAKERADEVPFAPLLSLFEHSAEVNPGNSGGPVVNAMGEVVGVTNAVSTQGFSAQELAISGLEAVEVVATLMAGDVIHPGFWALETGNISERYSGFLNLTVDRVDGGSAAERSGILPGDDVVMFGGVRDALGGLEFGAFCEELAAGGVRQDVVVHRWQESVHFAGRLGEPLVDISGFLVAQDPTDSLFTEVSNDWSDIRQIAPSDGNDWNGFRAAPDVDSFLNDFGRSPGTRVLYSEQLASTASTELYLDSVRYPQCDAGQTLAVSTIGFDGHFREWTNCFSEPFTIRSYAFDTFDGVRILVLTAASDVEIDWANALVLDSLDYAPPLVEEGDE